MRTVYHPHTSPTKPAPKPARTPREMATTERTRQIHEEGDQLLNQLFDAIQNNWPSSAHHTLDRMLGLSAEAQKLEVA